MAHLFYLNHPIWKILIRILHQSRKILIRIFEKINSLIFPEDFFAPVRENSDKKSVPATFEGWVIIHIPTWNPVLMITIFPDVFCTPVQRRLWSRSPLLPPPALCFPAPGNTEQLCWAEGAARLGLRPTKEGGEEGLEGWSDEAYTEKESMIQF